MQPSLKQSNNTNNNIHYKNLIHSWIIRIHILTYAKLRMSDKYYRIPVKYRQILQYLLSISAAIIDPNEFTDDWIKTFEILNTIPCNLSNQFTTFLFILWKRNWSLDNFKHHQHELNILTLILLIYIQTSLRNGDSCNFKWK